MQAVPPVPPVVGAALDVLKPAPCSEPYALAAYRSAAAVLHVDLRTEFATDFLLLRTPLL